MACILQQAVITESSKGSPSLELGKLVSWTHCKLCGFYQDSTEACESGDTKTSKKGPVPRMCPSQRDEGVSEEEKACQDAKWLEVIVP